MRWSHTPPASPKPETPFDFSPDFEQNTLGPDAME